MPRAQGYTRNGAFPLPSGEGEGEGRRKGSALRPWVPHPSPLPGGEGEEAWEGVGYFSPTTSRVPAPWVLEMAGSYMAEAVRGGRAKRPRVTARQT